MTMSQRLQRLDVVASCSLVSFFAERRRRAAGVAGGEEQRLDQREVALGLHAVHQHGADHAAPSDESYECHFSSPFRPVDRSNLRSPARSPGPE